MNKRNQLNIISLEERIVFDAAAAAVVAATVVYVDANAAGANTGTSWANAYTDLQSALTQAASTAGAETINIADGTYSPGNVRTATFVIPDQTTLIGGYGGETILSGDLLRNDVVNAPGAPLDNASHIDNSYHVVTATNVSFSMDTITIYGGYNEASGAIGQPGGDPVTGFVSGAGLNYTNGDAANLVQDHNAVTLSNMKFFDNYINGTTALVANGSGGAASILNPNAVNGDTLSVDVSHSLFFNNHAERLTSAMRINNATATISQTVFDSNNVETPFAANAGGGALSFGADANVPGIVGIIDHSAFTNNTAGGGGGSSSS